MQSSHKNNNVKSAFSLVEISVVLVIIGVLVTGIIGGQALMDYGTMSKARALTNSAPVSAIQGVQLWLETTSKQSFLTQKTVSNAEIVEGTEVQTWNDINPQGLAKKNATQSTATQIPTYKTSSIDGLPTMSFDGNDRFILPDGTIPPGNESYTVFIVSRNNTSTGTLLSGGDSGVALNGFTAQQVTGQIYDAWGSSNAIGSSISYDVLSPHIYTLKYDNTTGVGRTIYVDGNLASPAATATNRATISTFNRIGASVVSGTPTAFLNGDIGEIIIYNVALDNVDRASIENYLSQKWGINVAS